MKLLERSALLLCLLGATSCSLFGGKTKAPPPPGPAPTAAPVAEPTPAPTPPPPEGPLAVKKAPEDVIVAAWSEPARLPAGGGVAQIIVRLQKRGGAPFPGVEVRLQTSAGTLFSNSAILKTDGSGQTRDRLTARKTAQITLNAGGTVYRFSVPVAE
jgi:hypothetical protein